MQTPIPAATSYTGLFSRFQTQLLFMFHWSWLIFLASFFIAPKAKYVSNSFYYLLVPATILCWRYWPRTLFSTTGPKVFCLFLGYTVISCLWGDNEFLIRHAVKIALESIFLLLFFIAIATTQQISRTKMQQALIMLLIVASCSSIITIITWYTHHPFSTRLHGMYAFPQTVMTAWVYGVPTVICIQRFLNSSKLSSIVGYALLAIPLCSYMLLTQSRGPLLGLSVAGAFLIFYYNNRRSYTLAIIGFILLSIGFAAFYKRPYSTLNHFDIWQTTLHNALQAPWFGHGYGSSSVLLLPSQSFGHAHNVYLETFYLQGMVGLILLFGLYAAGLSQALKYIKQPDVVCALGILIFSSICMLTDNRLLVIGPHEIWLNFWGPLFYLFSKRYCNDIIQEANAKPC